MSNRWPAIGETTEIVVLFRNRVTGLESWMKLPNAVVTELDMEPEFEDALEPVEFYGGAIKFLPQAPVRKWTVTIKAVTDHYSMARDINEIHYDDRMRPNGDKP